MKNDHIKCDLIDDKIEQHKEDQTSFIVSKANIRRYVIKKSKDTQSFVY